jgi:hypothetical protein
MLYFARSYSICIKMHIAQDSATQDWQVKWSVASRAGVLAVSSSEQLKGG